MDRIKSLWQVNWWIWVREIRLQIMIWSSSEDEINFESSGVGVIDFMEVKWPDKVDWISREDILKSFMMLLS